MFSASQSSRFHEPLSGCPLISSCWALRRALVLRLGLSPLGVQRVRIHQHHHLSSRDEIAFVHENLPDPGRDFGGNVDLRGLDTAIAARQPFIALHEVALPDEYRRRADN
jgi:hypothetical protein